MSHKKQQQPRPFDEIRRKLESEMLQASSLQTEIERRGFVNRTFMSLHKASEEKRVNHDEYIKLINRLAAYAGGAFNDYIDLLAGAAHLGSGALEMVIQGELSQMTPNAARERRQQINEMTGTHPVKPEPPEEGKA